MSPWIVQDANASQTQACSGMQPTSFRTSRGRYETSTDQRPAMAVGAYEALELLQFVEEALEGSLGDHWDAVAAGLAALPLWESGSAATTMRVLLFTPPCLRPAASRRAAKDITNCHLAFVLR
jgi:hypothetical protein